jgi:integrase
MVRTGRPVDTSKRESRAVKGIMLEAAVDAGLIPETLCRRLPLPRVERQEMRFLTVDEVAVLAEAINPRYRALVLVGAFGGLRIGEMAGLRRARVDILRARVDVAEITVEVAGQLHTGPPKTRAGRRSISLPRSIADELGYHLGGWAGPDLVFTGPQGGPLRVPAWRRRFWGPAVVAAGLQPLRPHDLRHTAVALWIAQGANPKQVATRAGHTSVAFTLDRYGHLFPEADDALMSGLDAAHRAATKALDAATIDLSRPGTRLTV